MNNNDKQFMAQKIRAQYMEKQMSELDSLRALDAKVKRPVNIFSYVFGSFSAIVMGAGMSLVMTDIASMIGMGGDSMITGIVIGVIGMAMALVNYPIHKALMSSRKKKYAPEILAMSEKIMNK